MANENGLPLPANYRPLTIAPPVPTPVRPDADMAEREIGTGTGAGSRPVPQRLVPRLLGMEMLQLDSDLKPALEDMHAGSGQMWQPWLQAMVNEALRAYLGR